MPLPPLRKLLSVSSTLANISQDHSIEANCKSTAEFVAELNLMKKTTGATVIRTYTTSDCNILPRLLPALKQTDTKAVLGLWSMPDDHLYNKEIPQLEKYLGQYKDQVHAITVGSEALYRKEETAESLAKKMNKVKEVVKKAGADVPVGFADSWNLLIWGSAAPAIEAADIM